MTAQNHNTKFEIVNLIFGNGFLAVNLNTSMGAKSND